MLTYPSIPTWRDSKNVGKDCRAYVKYDGSNLRWEWSPKSGWHKFGVRHHLFDHTTPLFSQAIPLFFSGMSDAIIQELGEKHDMKKLQRITVFTEFFGPSSFAGKHIDDEPKELRLFDVFLFQKGFMIPKEFTQTFSKYSWAAQELYTGPMDESFITEVREGNYPTVEGVICKADKWSAKVKTISYLNKLREINENAWNQEKDE